ncbi:hypothetical protein GM661_07060 [Iocasia frigidifontis]|uniref:Uncharacterized protein n=1 Tax=Iocasia fonsfrigidae TaxID=2682810 RepID=A0A8A7KIQ5_9FIRM|nr:hypothetical protein [Iocasia fonsfrigidae]QTL97762.1 hypothetical protein GM661_07060 [Iocasia fonsfrigidae]
MIEKKSIKRTLILLISLTLLITLAACNGSETTLNQDKEKNEQISKARLAREEAERAEKRGQEEFVLTKEIYKEGDGSLKGTVEYDYDSHGNLLSVKYIGSDDSIVGNIEYKYNDRDLVIKREVKKHPEYFANKWIGNSSAWGMVKEVQEFPRYPNGIAKYTYNEDDQLIEYLEKDKETGEKLRIVKKEYYPSGNLKYEYEWRNSGYEGEFFYEDVYIRYAYEWTKSTEKRNNKVTISEHVFDENGNILSDISITRNSEGVIVDRYNSTSEYNEQGNIIRAVGNIITFEYEYNHKGNLIREITKDSTGNIDDIYEYEYDDRGNVIKLKYKNPKLSSCSEITYDEYNNKIKAIRKRRDGSIRGIEEYEYMKVGELSD